MTTNTKQKAAGATNTNGLHTDTNGADFRTGDATGQYPDGKAFIQSVSYWLIQSAPYALVIVLAFVVRACT